MAEGLVRNEDGVTRCRWGGGDDLAYRAYHDDEWGLPVTDDVRLFEKLALEGFQAGLSWLTILRKREAFRHAFAGFDFHEVARFGERDVERLLGDATIVRHRGKIESTVNNARRAIELVEAEGSLAAFVWRFEPDRAVRPGRVTHEALRGVAHTTRHARSRRSSSAAAGHSSARRRSTRSCRRWASSTTTSRVATHVRGSRRRGLPSRVP